MCLGFTKLKKVPYEQKIFHQKLFDRIKLLVLFILISFKNKAQNNNCKNMIMVMLNFKKKISKKVFSVQNIDEPFSQKMNRKKKCIFKVALYHSLKE